MTAYTEGGCLSPVQTTECKFKACYYELLNHTERGLVIHPRPNLFSALEQARGALLIRAFVMPSGIPQKGHTDSQEFYENLKNQFVELKNPITFASPKFNPSGMTKSDIVNDIAERTGIEKIVVQTTVEAFMRSVKNAMVKGDNVYLRGFGSFVVKKRAEKTGRNISRNTIIIIPAHNIPSFKPAKTFLEKVKKNVKVSG